MKSRSKVTLRDVALKANVSTSTVSRALNDFEFVEESTRATILQAAKELGYAGKSTLSDRQRKKPHQKTVLMLVRSANYDAGQEVSLAGVERRISNGVIDACQSLNLPTRTQLVKMNEVDARLLSQDESLLGVIFLGGLVEPNFARIIEDTLLPFVVAGAPVADVDLNCVTADYGLGAELAVDHLIKSGRSRIGFVNGSPKTMSSTAKYKGFRLGLALHGMAFAASQLYVGDFSSESGYAATVQILENSPDVDAILYASDEMAIGGLHALKERSRKVPDDVAIVGYHCTHAGQFTDPPLTSVDVDLRQLGWVAGQRLYQLYLDTLDADVNSTQINNGQLSALKPRNESSCNVPWTMVVSPSLVVRQSA